MKNQTLKRFRAPLGRLACVLGILCWLSSAAQPSQAAPSLENPHGDLSISCSDCHSTAGWTPLLEPLLFDHAGTGFELVAGHGRVECLSCHQGLEFSNVGSACADCHLDPHEGELGFSCELCHSPTSWDARGDFAELHDGTLFPLTGAHRSVDCAACHTEDPPFEFQLTPTDCFLCHVEDYRDAEPDHAMAGFPTSCEDCHFTDAWQPATFGGGDFDHDAFFPLRGSHEVLDCSACHAGGFAGTPTDCVACHADDYNSTTDPNHVALGFPTSCEQCHGTTTWEGATAIEHDEFFPLLGVHAVLDCQACHADGFEGTPTDCFACHAADYNGTTDPNHAAQGFSTDCEDCHSESSWDVDEIDHAAFFPLLGAHQVLDCESCHADGFAGTPTDCFACHVADYNGTTDPNHVAEGFPTDCEECHSESTWMGADIDHDSFFPLTGAHGPLDCTSCHADGFAGTPTDCFSCHEEDYRMVEDPDHVAAGFPTMCEDCHTTTTWDGAAVDHSFFALTQGHGGLDCEDCHSDGFENTPTDCVACHRDDYDATTDPNHAQAGLPTDCEQCHTIADWDAEDIDHSFFPLTQGHGGLDCQDCHAGGFENTPTDCAACHLDDYNNTNDPNHQSAGFPTTCEDCHNTSDWDDADFDHDALYFPIFSGSHDGEWDDCTDCHVQANDFGVFECIFCHEHNQEDMDDEHDDVNGYEYESMACLNCHPDGEE